MDTYQVLESFLKWKRNPRMSDSLAACLAGVAAGWVWTLGLPRNGCICVRTSISIAPGQGQFPKDKGRRGWSSMSSLNIIRLVYRAIGVILNDHCNIKLMSINTINSYIRPETSTRFKTASGSSSCLAFP